MRHIYLILNLFYHPTKSWNQIKQFDFYTTVSYAVVFSFLFSISKLFDIKRYFNWHEVSNQIITLNITFIYTILFLIALSFLLSFIFQKQNLSFLASFRLIIFSSIPLLLLFSLYYVTGYLLFYFLTFYSCWVLWRGTLQIEKLPNTKIKYMVLSGSIMLFSIIVILNFIVNWIMNF